MRVASPHHPGLQEPLVPQSPAPRCYHESYRPGEEEELGLEEGLAPPKFPPMFVRPTKLVVLVTVVFVVGMALCLTVFKEDLEEHGITSEHLFKFSSIPIVSVIFTYCHIWWALWMTFYPIQFFGFCQIRGTNIGLGWQGIIPSKAEKMARLSIQLLTEQLMDVKEMFSKLDPHEMAVEMEPVLRGQLAEVVQDLAQEFIPKAWDGIPQHVKSEIMDAAYETVPGMVVEMNRDLQQRIDEVFDLETMVVEHLVRDKELLCDTFIRCGHRELAFIRNSGVYMGLLFGLGQMVAWIFYQASWLLPLIGFVVGALTNWLALKMIFSPVEPKVVCGITLHGLFLRRQAAVAAEYGRIVATNILSSRQILSGFFAGPSAGDLFALVEGHVSRATENFANVHLKLVDLTIGLDVYEQLKKRFTSAMVARMPEALMSIEDYVDQRLDLSRTLREKMQALPSKQFERLVSCHLFVFDRLRALDAYIYCFVSYVFGDCSSSPQLHPVFEEDEWKLVLLGGALGLLIGLCQAYVLKTD